MLENEAGAWHTLQSLDSGTVLLEMKDGHMSRLRLKIF